MGEGGNKVENTAVSDVVLNESALRYSYKPSSEIPTQYGGVISNIVVTTILNEVSDIKKGIDINFVGANMTVTYTSVIKNFNTSTLANVVFKDTIPVTTKFIQDSVYINGVNKVGYNPETSFPVGINLKPNEEVTITFNILTGESGYGTIPNTSSFTGELLIENRGILVKRDSNEVYFKYAYPSIEIIKSTDKNFVDRGEDITYTIVLKNTGAANLLNLIFKDTIPQGTFFVNNSMKINGAPVNGSPEGGINLPIIKVGEVVTLNFIVRVVGK